MRIAIITLILILSNIVFGQSQLIGLTSGANLNNGNNFFGAAKSQFGFSGGLTYETRLSNRFKFETDVIYTKKSYAFEVNFTGPTGNSFPIASEFYFTYDYLSIPIKGGLFFGENMKGFVNFGLVPSLLVSAKNLYPLTVGPDGNGMMQADDISQFTSNFDLAGLLEFGGNFALNDQFILFGTIGYQRSINDLSNFAFFTKGAFRHNSINANLGLKYVLK